ncbi:hypothetical protein [Streptomyces sp. NPDC054874]
MTIDPLVSRARALWREPAAEPAAAFGTSGQPTAPVAPDSCLAPPSWVGVVAVGDAALIRPRWVAPALGSRERGRQLSVPLS